jgi:flagellar motility protein MotE (MotC chaperone)
MKNFIFLIATVLVFNINLTAQENSDFHERGTERINKALNLSEEQLSKAKEIHSKYKPDIDKINEEAKPLRDKIKLLREKKINEFEAILNQEQKNKLIEMKRQHGGKVHKH